jgi:hypothetical protein
MIFIALVVWSSGNVSAGGDMGREIDSRQGGSVDFFG